MNPWLRYGFIFIFMVALYAVFAWSMGIGNSKSTSAAYAVGVIIIAAIIGEFLEKRFPDKRRTENPDSEE